MFFQRLVAVVFTHHRLASCGQHKQLVVLLAPTANNSPVDHRWSNDHSSTAFDRCSVEFRTSDIPKWVRIWKLVDGLVISRLIIGCKLNL